MQILEYYGIESTNKWEYLGYEIVRSHLSLF